VLMKVPQFYTLVSLVNTVGVSTTSEQVMFWEGIEWLIVIARETCQCLHPYYTFTPTLQNSATTPKPPRILAIDATAVSRNGNVSFGRVEK